MGQIVDAVFMSTLTCQIKTARCLLGRGFSLTICDKPNASISNVLNEACKDYYVALTFVE